MLGKLLLLFTGVTLVELFLLVQLGRWMGLVSTLVLVIAMGFLGAWLARKEGLRVLQRVRADLDAGRLPAESALDGLLLLIAAAFLITPGILTDTAGLLLLLPFVRRPIKRRLREHFRRWIAQGRVHFVRGAPFGDRRPPSADVIDVPGDSADPGDQSR